MIRFPFGHSPRTGLHPLMLTLAVTLWLVILGNVPLWRQLSLLPDVTGLRGLLFSIGMGCLIAGVIHTLLSLLNWPWMLKPVLTLFLVSAASGAYFMLSYGIVIDPTMIENVTQTDPREAADLLNWRMCIAFLVLAVLPAWWIWTSPVKRLSLGKQLLTNGVSLLLSLAVTVLSLLAIYQDFASVMRNHNQVRYLINPLNSFFLSAGWQRSLFSATTPPSCLWGKTRSCPCRLGKHQPPSWWCWVKPRAWATSASMATSETPPHVWRKQRDQPAQCVVLRNQHGGLGALHVFAPGTRSVRPTQKQP